MRDYEARFIELALKSEALCFGEFTLKSGRQSPYFFNAGRFNTGKALAELGYCYAAAIAASNIDFDLLFGPAYKGIPLAAVTSAALATHFAIDKPYAFNRKEAKQHGEGGQFVGADVAGKILIIDDVITAGTAIREIVNMVGSCDGAQISSVIVGLDRQETLSDQSGQAGQSAVSALAEDLDIRIESIINIEHLIEYLSNSDSTADDNSRLVTLQAIRDYRGRYGSQD